MTDDELHRQVDKLLIERGFIVVDGLAGQTSQTGQRYKQKIILAKPEEAATTIADFISIGGNVGDTVYWRIRPEVSGDRIYIRFLVSNRKAAA